MEENELQTSAARPNDNIIEVTGVYQDRSSGHVSYVILERAVPAIEDSFKSVQRRITHSLKELDNGHYNNCFSYTSLSP